MSNRESDQADALNRALPEILTVARQVRGFLSETEMKFLAMIAACPTGEGVVLEIGSFLGKSTTLLALAGKLAPGTQIVAVDPLDYRPSFDPKRGVETCADEFHANLHRANVECLVEFHQMRSNDLAPKWRAGRKIRVLWVDGDHSYDGAKADFDLFSPHLADGAIVALHDCFRHDVGPMRVLAEDILLSKNFGAAGGCGSIGWGQFRVNPEHCAPFAREKLSFYRKVSRLIPDAYLDPVEHGTGSMFYKLMRALVPHGEVDPADWVQRVKAPC